MHSKRWVFGALAGALLGTLFAGLSTLDFTEHLDRQLHPLHCSFIPGVASGGMGEAGCRAVMNSRFSSFFRDVYWGGIPLALLALAVFAYLLFLTAEMWLSGRIERKSEAGYLAIAGLLPLGMSLVMFTISAVEVGAFCKLCIGIYFSSSLYALSTILLWRETRADFTDRSRAPLYLLEGFAFVGAAIFVYLISLPSYDVKVKSCGTLKKPEDKQKVMLTLASGGQPTIEVIDPLCPACKAFETRLQSADLLQGMQRQVLLFPLDSECNWMLQQSMHPGACMVSRALICADKDMKAMLDYIIDNQEEFRIVASKAPAEIQAKLQQKFPAIAGCIDAPDTKIRLNNMLRYAMNNRLPITTPQLYIANQRLCDEDSDLGLDYSVRELRSQK